MANVKIKGTISPNIFLVFGVFVFAFLLFKGFRDSLNAFFLSIPDALKLKDPKLISDLATQLTKSRQQLQLENKAKETRANKIRPAITKWAPLLKVAGKISDFSSRMIAAVMINESFGNPSAFGKNFDVGLMQLTPIAVKDVNENFPRQKKIHRFLQGTAGARDNLVHGALYLQLQSERMKKAGSQNLTFDTFRAYNKGFSGALKNKNAGRIYAENVFFDVAVIQKFNLI